MVPLMNRPVLFRVAAAVACVAGISAIYGCGGFSPFLAAQFASTIPGGRVGSTFAPGSDEPPTDTTVLASIGDLTTGQRGIQVSIENQATQRVRFAITFAVSAGAGGLVPDDLVQDYVNAGYGDAFAPGSASTFAVGCDLLTLNSGTRLLIMKFGVEALPEEFLQPNTTGDTQGNVPTLTLRRRDNGDDTIPIPELIVFGNASSNFTCLGSDLCTQRGFVYSSINNLPIGKAADALHIQGTVCNAGFGTAPEWRLDRTVFDGFTQTFQYPVGATIVIAVLDRSGDSLGDPRNQVVWTVTDDNDTTVHNPLP